MTSETEPAQAARSRPRGSGRSDDAGKPVAVPRVAGAVLRGVALRPTVWPAAAAEMVRLAPSGWWRRWPPLPWPDAALWRFRMETAYGGEGDAVPRPSDVRSFLRWCGDMHRWRRV